MVDKKLEAFNKNKVENYKASCRLEGLKVEATPHPELHERHEVRSYKVEWPDYHEYMRECYRNDPSAFKAFYGEWKE